MQIYLGSIRLRMVLKARELMRCPKGVYVDRGENSPRTQPQDTPREGRITKETKKKWLEPREYRRVWYPENQVKNVEEDLTNHVQCCSVK